MVYHQSFRFEQRSKRAKKNTMKECKKKKKPEDPMVARREAGNRIAKGHCAATTSKNTQLFTSRDGSTAAAEVGTAGLTFFVARYMNTV